MTREGPLTMHRLDELRAILSALDNPHRLRIIALLHEERLHVSELARRLDISRPLLYMHLDKLETAGIVKGNHEIKGGKAMKYMELNEFDVRLTPATIARTMEA